MLLLEGGHETAPDFAFMVLSLLSNDARKEFIRINPFISPEQIEPLVHLVTVMVLRVSAISQINRLVLDCSKLERMVQALRDAWGGGDLSSKGSALTESAKQVRIKGIVYLANSVAAALQVQRHSMTEQGDYDPRIVVFEFVRSVLLREQQVKLVENFVEAVGKENLASVDKDPDNDNLRRLAQQMLMGQGASTPLCAFIHAMEGN